MPALFPDICFTRHCEGATFWLNDSFSPSGMECLSSSRKWITPRDDECLRWLGPGLTCSQAWLHLSLSHVRWGNLRRWSWRSFLLGKSQIVMWIQILIFLYGFFSFYIEIPDHSTAYTSMHFFLVYIRLSRSPSVPPLATLVSRTLVGINECPPLELRFFFLSHFT